MAYTVTGPLTNPALAAETAAISGPPPFDISGVPSGDFSRIHGVLNLTAGAGTTAVVIKLRRGANTTTGTQVGTSLTYTLAAAASADIAYDFEDTGQQFLAGQYTVTLTQTGGTANGTLNAGTMVFEPTQ